MSTPLTSFFTSASARGARSTALHSLQWMLGMLLAAIPLSLLASAPSWLLIALAGAIGLVLCVFVGAYVYLLLRQPDALRSEEFTLSKLALEKGLIGDNLVGLVESPQIQNNLRQVPQLTSAEGEDQ